MLKVKTLISELYELYWSGYGLSFEGRIRISLSGRIRFHFTGSATLVV